MRYGHGLSNQGVGAPIAHNTHICAALRLKMTAPWIRTGAKTSAEMERGDQGQRIMVRRVQFSVIGWAYFSCSNKKNYYNVITIISKVHVYMYACACGVRVWTCNSYDEQIKAASI